MMKALQTGFSLLLPVLVVGGLWLVAEEGQQKARFERVMRYVPSPSIVLRPPQEPLPAGDTLVDLSAKALDSLLPATL